MTTAAQAIKTTVSKDGRTATVSIPVTFLQRGGRKQILTPPGAAPWSPAPRVDTALVKAVVRAHRWRQMLESGEYNSSAELAKAEKVERLLRQPHTTANLAFARHHGSNCYRATTQHAAD